MFYRLAILIAVAAYVTAIENNKPVFQKSIKELGEEIRDRRNLEYSLNLPHSHVASFRSLERRISTGPHEGHLRNLDQLYQARPGYGLLRRSRPSLPAPPYAVQMEPMVQYSQKDPLYDANGENLEEGINRNEIHAQPKILTVNLGDQFSENNHPENVYASAYSGGFPPPGPPYGQVVLPYYEHPEPIIEIIIKESNESLPPPIVSAPVSGPRPKEPVQVFYVKYQQNPHGDGKDVIYDRPVAAITPPSNLESDYHEEHTTVAPEGLTLSPPPSTTLRAIIRPDSENYHSDSGVRITFGTEEKHHNHNSYPDSGSPEDHEESAPHVAVALPQGSRQQNAPHPQFQKRQQAPPLRDLQPFQTQSFVQHQQNHVQHAQQRIQYQPSFPQNYQQLPHSNAPNQPFRSTQDQFARPPFNGPPHGPPQGPPRGPPSGPHHGPPQGPPQASHHGPPQGPPPASHQGPSQGPSHGPPQSLTSGPPQNIGPNSHHGPVSRPPPNFQSRPNSQNGPNSQRGPFQVGSQRPFHQGPQPQQLQFNEHEYLQQNYHTITTEQFEPPREQQLPSKSAGNFREPPRKPIQAPIPLTQEEYNQRYYEQLQQLQQQERNRQRPQPNQAPQSGPPVRFQQQIAPPQKPVSVQFNKSQPPKSAPLPQNSHIQQSPPFNIQQQQFNQAPPTLKPLPPVPQQFQHQILGQQFIPPGGELIASIPKYEQHLLINPNVQGPAIQQNTQQSQIIQTQNFPQPSPLIQQQVSQNTGKQEVYQNQIQQQFTNNAPLISSTDFLSAYEQNQQEILQLQAKLKKSEEEQQKLIATSQRPTLNTSNFKSNQQVSTQNNQQFSFQNQPHSVDIDSDRIVQIQSRNPQSRPYVAHNTNRPPLIASTGSSSYSPSTTPRYVSSTSNSIVDKAEPEKKEKSKKPIDFELPDEVPDELRQQLLSSGILENAQISILDYDKVGDIPLESLPPDQLANFYGAGGGLQISGSAPVASVVKPNGEAVKHIVSEDDDDQVSDQDQAGSERIESFVDTYGKKKDVEMKVVHFDPNTAKGQQVAGKYVQKDATRIDPVSLNDHKYNRYLPLKVSGAQFPLPDVPELKGRKVTSVVVLAPVDYDFAKNEKERGRSERAASNKSKGVNFVAGDALKRLVKTPTIENYKKWLEKENSTSPDLQSVVLLVTGTDDGEEKNKEIFMYDVSTQTVSRLSGELSSAFVEVAETNAHSKDFDQLAIADSGIVESSVRAASEAEVHQKNQKSTQKETKYNNHKPVYAELDAKKMIEKRDPKDKITDYGIKLLTDSSEVNNQESRHPVAEVVSEEEDKERPVNQVLISSGYSRMKLGRSLHGDNH